MATYKKSTIDHNDHLNLHRQPDSDDLYQLNEHKNRNRRRNRSRGQDAYQSSRSAVWQDEDIELFISR
jgi:hypothetical protein